MSTSFTEDMREATEIFEHLQETENAYLYFELAFSRHTGWMCWLVDREGSARHVFAQGQGSKKGALVPVLDVLRRMADGKVSSRSMAFKDAEQDSKVSCGTPTTDVEALRLSLSNLMTAIRAVGQWDGPRVGNAMENAERTLQTTKEK